MWKRNYQRSGGGAYQAKPACGHVSLEIWSWLREARDLWPATRVTHVSWLAGPGLGIMLPLGNVAFGYWSMRFPGNVALWHWLFDDNVIWNRNVNLRNCAWRWLFNSQWSNFLSHISSSRNSFFLIHWPLLLSISNGPPIFFCSSCFQMRELV